MSAGLTPQDFVQQVFYMQEKVLLDFYPTDDKYREVIMEGNLVLQELQKEEDWAWLRKTKALGLTEHDGIIGVQSSFDLGEDVYKLSTLYGDCVRLYAHKPLPPEEERAEDFDLLDYIIPFNYITVPLISIGSKNKFPTKEVSWYGKPNTRDFTLGAYVLGDRLYFSRLLGLNEIDRVVVVDYQKNIEQLHICSSSCQTPCTDIEEIVFTDIPDPNYVVIKTAYYHAMGSPTAQGMLASLSDMCQKVLSAMRENNFAATAPDYMEYDVPGFIEVV